MLRASFAALHPRAQQASSRFDFSRARYGSVQSTVPFEPVVKKRQALA